MICARCSTVCVISRRRAASGVGCRAICLRGQRCTSRPGAEWRRVVSRLWWAMCSRSYASGRAEKVSPRRFVSTAVPSSRPRSQAHAPATTGPSGARAQSSISRSTRSGHLLALTVTAADEGDRSQVAALAEQVQQVTGNTVQLAYVDQGYTGPNVAEAAQQHGIQLEIVKHPWQKGLRAAAQTLGRGTKLRLARTLPTPRQKLRTARHHPQRLPLRRLCDPHGSSTHQNRSYNFITASSQTVMHCPCGAAKVLAKGLCSTCYTLKRQDEEYFGGHREEVLKRDDYRCRVPGCTTLKRGKRSVAVHYREPGNSDPAKMLTVCLPCHARVRRTSTCRTTGQSSCGYCGESNILKGMSRAPWTSRRWHPRRRMSCSSKKWLKNRP